MVSKPILDCLMTDIIMFSDKYTLKHIASITELAALNAHDTKTLFYTNISSEFVVGVKGGYTSKYLIFILDKATGLVWALGRANTLKELHAEVSVKMLAAKQRKLKNERRKAD